MDLAQIEAFLILAEELHFGRTSQRLYVSQPMVSRRIAALEGEVGGALFERTSRRVRLTPLGAAFLDDLRPGYAQIEKAVQNARAAARAPEGLLTIGFTATTEGPEVTRLVDAYRRSHPDSDVTFHQVATTDPYGDLRRGEVDVLVNWLAVDEPDLTVGPLLDCQERVLAVSTQHPLATRESISLEDLAGLPMAAPPPTFPSALLRTIIPLQTPSGQPLPRTHSVRDMAEMWSLVAAGKIVHPTVSSIGRIIREDIELIPIRDMPPLPLGLIWCTAHENARIRSLAEVARALGRTAPGLGVDRRTTTAVARPMSESSGVR